MESLLWQELFYTGHREMSVSYTQLTLPTN